MVQARELYIFFRIKRKHGRHFFGQDDYISMFTVRLHISKMAERTTFMIFV